ncbi:ARMT1-like domain-containing protein [Pseudodesulfovibrio thermohalotolerans]|uniref:damage-control phosphatase ARMT1 family protein n=1 Tax=Pseudodesulfovibrio thermohalotolerans TaxID=2880651 RepID=UPI002441FD48|nr:ARMT1-like domain-containing protein [Pseudodesulfovibrio thermohalotolerans]WFS61056.1 ARMT1-like domain-containing protein [Pseudodesulfovibrio thermohalotolerans]
MDTALECMPCFKRMAVREAQIACPNDPDLREEILTRWEALLPRLNMDEPPPAIARLLAELVREVSGCRDLYVEDKKAANEFVLGLLPSLEERVEAARATGDSLSLALELSIIGNYIDRGVELEFDLEKELADVAGSVSPDALAAFAEQARPGVSVLILGDNTGEIVLDTLLVRELSRLGCDVTYAVRSKPVLNDATMADAKAVGMTELCPVVESGVDTPGTVLSRCTPEFLQRMRESDVILSKGQGNFEALNGVWAGVFCAFKVKCPRIARKTGLNFGESALCVSVCEGPGGNGAGGDHA